VPSHIATEQHPDIDIECVEPGHLTWPGLHQQPRWAPWWAFACCT